MPSHAILLGHCQSDVEKEHNEAMHAPYPSVPLVANAAVMARV